jgi:hypothetical protein
MGVKRPVATHGRQSDSQPLQLFRYLGQTAPVKPAAITRHNSEIAAQRSRYVTHITVSASLGCLVAGSPILTGELERSLKYDSLQRPSPFSLAGHAGQA